jgi:hypothetical protein
MASRTYYASQAVGLYPKGFLPTTTAFGGTYNAGYGSEYMYILSGVQSVGFSSSVEFEQVFELGHLQIFENIEGSPTCEMTIERILGLGVTSLYERFCTSETRDYGINMSNFASDRGCSARLSVQADGAVMTNTGSAGNTTTANKLYGFQLDGFTSNYSISAQTDGAVTESLGIAGVNLTLIPSGATDKTLHVRPTTSNPYGTFRRQDCSFQFTKIINSTMSGTTTQYSRVQSASINIDVGREDLLELGRKGPYIRYASFPVEVTCDVEYNVDRGIDVASDPEPRFQNTTQQMVEIDSDSNCQLNPTEGYLVEVKGSRRHSTSASLGCSDSGYETGGTQYNFLAAISGAKLQSQSWSGGDTGGGVVTISESYTAFNAARVIAGYTGNQITASAAKP